MLKTCPECGNQVSDKAAACPRCGYPINESRKTQQSKRRKRRRLPNGFGQITKITNQNLRKPYRAMVTVYKDECGKPVCKLLKPEAYFKTYNEAYSALLEYNNQGYVDGITVAEVYRRWSKVEYSEYPSSESHYKPKWQYFDSVKHLPMREIRTQHIKQTIEMTNTTPSTKQAMKTLWNKLFKYALAYEYADKNYAELYKIPRNLQYKVPRNAHNAFTDHEISIMWNNIPDMCMKILFIQCYTGFRPQELLKLKLTDIDMVNGFITGGMKTAAGKNRIVPIHPKIKPFIESFFNSAMDDNLFPIEYDEYLKFFKKRLPELGIEGHLPHDGRKHFITMAKQHNLDEYAIKYIVGHKIADITENTYTERKDSWLKQEILKIPV